MPPAAYYTTFARAHAVRWRWLSLRRREPGFRPAVVADPDAPALLLSPHLDDVVFSCWSVLTAPGPRRVVNVFAGVPRPGFVTRWDRACGAQESAAHVRARIAEDAEVVGAVGVASAYLPFVDRQYGAPAPRLVELDAAVAEVAPAASAVYAPAALGFSHTDHLLVREYARVLGRHGMPVMLYADLPYAVRSGEWPAWVREARPDRSGTPDAFWRPALRAVPELGEATVVALDAGAAAAKLEAMRAYSSQFPGLDHDGRLSDPRTHGREVYWRLTPLSGS